MKQRPFKLSRRWLAHHPKHKWKRGLIIGESRDKENWIVLFSGHKTPQSYLKVFIQPLREKTLTISDFVACIPWGQIQDTMGPVEFDKFNHWMRGQTCLQEGVYIGDLDRYLRGLPVID